MKCNQLERRAAAVDMPVTQAVSDVMHRGGKVGAVALVAHDRNKDAIVKLAITHEAVLETHDLYSTATTGSRIMENTSLNIHRFMSGPLGGDQQIGAMVARDEMDLLIFLRDPLVTQPHGSDINALFRLCDAREIPLATNIVTAELLVRTLGNEGHGWRDLVRGFAASHAR